MASPPAPGQGTHDPVMFAGPRGKLADLRVLCSLCFQPAEGRWQGVALPCPWDPRKPQAALLQVNSARKSLGLATKADQQEDVG